MIRAASKNHAYVAIRHRSGRLCRRRRTDYRMNGVPVACLPQEARAKRLRPTAAYDAAISNWMAEDHWDRRAAWRAFGGTLAQVMRYGENPHQTAASMSRRQAAGRRHGDGRSRASSFPTTTSTTPTRPSSLVSGVRPRRGCAACAIIKHANPCGVADRRPPAARPIKARWPATAPRPSAASSRSTAA
jgi:phosphoribosylaminoimidazolecarboxamide formyltransferase/IMP cyclohydrolase